MAVVCAVDVGTRSARAGIFDTRGNCLARSEHPIAINEPMPGYAEYASDEIWDAVCAAVRQARESAAVEPGDVVGIGFDATCSLVVLDSEGRPLTISSSGDVHWNTIVWMDHRAIAEASECTATAHPMLDFAGGAMSPEMQAPKAMWLKRHLPETWQRAGYLFDLPDFLTWRASGSNARSNCTLVSKWPYLAHDSQGWQTDFLDRVDLSDLLERGNLPTGPMPVGADLGPLTQAAGEELGLTSNCRVAAALVDAFAGALGVRGPSRPQISPGNEAALVAGTSSCVMVYSNQPQAIPGFWGPYFEATLPDLWMSEGGQSATGALLDYIVRIHGAGGEPTVDRHRRIAERVSQLRAREGPAFAARLHVLPDFHGNRTPLADPAALGVISGLSLDASFDGLCRLYWRACVGIALGLRHILETMREHGRDIDTLHVTGGHTRNPLLMELYADATGCRLIVPDDDIAMLAGTAMAAATGAKLFPDLVSACEAMRPSSHVVAPDAAARDRLDRDFRVFLEMHRQRRMLEAIG